MFKNDDANPTWSVESGYTNGDFDAYPYRAFSGADFGFNVVLNLETSDIDFLCRGPVQGYKMKIHSPNEHPRMATGYQRIPFNSEILVGVRPEINLNSDKNFCHSSSTKSLELFKEYSQANCVTECISSHVETRCGCVKFSMVHNSKTGICNQHHTKCISEALEDFSLRHTSEKGFQCDCKPSCDRLRFDTKVSQAVFDFKRVFSAFQENITEEFPSSIMSRLVVFLEDDSYVPSTHIAKDNTIDKLAKIGGVLAFFLGASLLSIIEIFYYVVRRFTC